MDSISVAEYLRQHPHFFEEHSGLIDHMKLTHPQSGAAVSMVERQVLSLRERVAQLEARLNELSAYGVHNDALSEKMHRLALALLGAPDAEVGVAVLHESMRSDFNIPQSVVRWWGGALEGANLADIGNVSNGFLNYVAGLTAPYVGGAAAHESRGWFENGESLNAFAYVPLRDRELQGVLILASGDPTRFTPDMATDVLTRLGEIATIALARDSMAFAPELA